METLFKTDKSGRKRMFDIRVEKLEDGTANIVRTTGLGDGKKTTSVTHVRLGYESALKRAKTMWENQKEIKILPMLAHNWTDKQKHIQEPFYVQPKLDGVRILVSNKGGISRTGKVVPGTEQWGKGLKDGEYLDGECYSHGMAFEDITSAFKTNPTSLEFHVFDYFDTNKPDLTFEERKKRITVPTQLVKSKGEIQKLHDAYATQGYEGIMIRNRFSTYEIGHRSNDLLKYKAFQTEEYKIVGVHEGTGRDMGTPIWECVTQDGAVFSVRPEGSMESRREQFKNSLNIVGKQLTVRFQNLTSGSVPRFPVGIAIRDYE